MKDLLTYLLKGILPDENFEITESTEGDRLTLTIKVPKDHIGLVIGKGGHTIKSLRNLLKIRATLEKKAVFITVEG